VLPVFSFKSALAQQHAEHKQGNWGVSRRNNPHAFAAALNIKRTTRVKCTLHFSLTKGERQEEYKHSTASSSTHSSTTKGTPSLVLSFQNSRPLASVPEK